MARGLRIKSSMGWTIDFSDAEDVDEHFVEMQTAFRAIFNHECAPLVIAQYGADDVVAMNETFCNFVDSMHRDGMLCDEFADMVTLDD